MKNSNKSKSGGGYTNYSLRSATLVENYVPGPMRTNLLMDPEKALGLYDPGTFGSDQWLNGPGTLTQALPDLSKYQTNRVFANPRANPYRNFAVDDRQLATYQVEQLQNNPLSQYTNNPGGAIPSFECMQQPDNYSRMINKRESELKNDFKTSDFYNPLTTTADVYTQYSGDKVNPNAEIVYNMSMNSKEEVNPMISLGSSSVSVSKPQFSGKCYSGAFEPSALRVSDLGGNDFPGIYGGNTYVPISEEDRGFINKQNHNNRCISDRSLNFANGMIL